MSAPRVSDRCAITLVFVTVRQRFDVWLNGHVPVDSRVRELNNPSVSVSMVFLEIRGVSSISNGL